MRFVQAIVRRPGSDMAAGITTANLGTPNHTAALAQFDAYVRVLTECGLAVSVLEALPGCPDAHFVEDTAVITPEIAVITNPGADARKGEVASITDALRPYRRTIHIQPPGTVDGGDVLVVGRQVFIGISARTNPPGARQLGSILEDIGYRCKTVPVAAGLHFKSSVNAVGEDILLTTAEFAEHPALTGYRRIVVAPTEAYAANTLWVNETLIMPAGFPDTRHQLDALEKSVIEIDTGEFRKMDGGLTCLSLRF